CFELGGLGAALPFQRARCIVELEQRKTVSVQIFKKRVPCLPASPGRFHGRNRKTHAAVRPCFEHALYIFRKKAKSSVLANALVLRGSFRWTPRADPGQPCSSRSGEPASSRRSDDDPPKPFRSFHVYDRLEGKLFFEEPPAPLLIAHPKRHKIQTEKRLQECRPQSRPVRAKDSFGMHCVFHR